MSSLLYFLTHVPVLAFVFFLFSVVITAKVILSLSNFIQHISADVIKLPECLSTHAPGLFFFLFFLLFFLIFFLEGIFPLHCCLLLLHKTYSKIFWCNLFVTPLELDGTVLGFNRHLFWHKDSSMSSHVLSMFQKCRQNNEIKYRNLN